LLFLHKLFIFDKCSCLFIVSGRTVRTPGNICAFIFCAFYNFHHFSRFSIRRIGDIHILWRSSLMVLDKISIIGVVLYGGYVFFRKWLCVCGWIDEVKMLHITCIIYTFVLTIYLYYFGFLHKKYCFHENKMVANIWHSFLHLVSCIGHILIVLL